MIRSADLSELESLLADLNAALSEAEPLPAAFLSRRLDNERVGTGIAILREARAELGGEETNEEVRRHGAGNRDGEL